MHNSKVSFACLFHGLVTLSRPCANHIQLMYSIRWKVRVALGIQAKGRAGILFPNLHAVCWSHPPRSHILFGQTYWYVWERRWICDKRYHINRSILICIFKEVQKMFIKICTVPFRVVIMMANMPSNKTQTNKTSNYRKNHNAVH